MRDMGSATGSGVDPGYPPAAWILVLRLACGLIGSSMPTTAAPRSVEISPADPVEENVSNATDEGDSDDPN